MRVDGKLKKLNAELLGIEVTDTAVVLVCRTPSGEKTRVEIVKVKRGGAK